MSAAQVKKFQSDAIKSQKDKEKEVGAFYKRTLEILYVNVLHIFPKSWCTESFVLFTVVVTS